MKSNISTTQSTTGHSTGFGMNSTASLSSSSSCSSSTARSECVKVVVRCRPLSKKEEEDGQVKVVEVNCKAGTIQLQKPINNGNGTATTATSHSSLSSNSIVDNDSNNNNNVKIYTFDSVYDGQSTQEEIYADVCHPIVESVLNGFNGTIFAYGQTGTGKTFTMEGTNDDPGIIPRSFIHIFGHISRSSHKQFLVRSSYLEIYQEEIRDLLSSNVNKKLELRESPEIGVYVKDLSSFVCKNVKEIERVLSKGRQNRSTGATNMNEHSSRSHAIFMITIEHIEKKQGRGGENAEEEEEEHIRVGKLNLVDLAGSERQIKTKTIGTRQKEAIKINLSLSALGNVISALVDGRSSHIPYRDSKLTRLLQDSLGGNARTIMIANIGPAAYNYDETLITLRYANRAKNIKNKPRINENPKDTLLKEFQAEIERLRCLLEEKRRQKKAKENINPMSAISNTNSNNINETIVDIEAVEKLQAQIRAMESKMLVGGKDILDYTNEQQKQLEIRMAELREQRQRERIMLRQLEEHEEATQEVRETFTSLQQEVEMKRRKLKKIIKEFQSINSEINDLNETHSEERRELERISSDLIRDLKLRYLMIDNFIPEHEKQRFLRKVYYDENEQDWLMKEKKKIKQKKSGNRLNQSMMVTSSTTIDDQEDQEITSTSRPCTAASSSFYSSSRPCSSYSERSSSALPMNDEHQQQQQSINRWKFLRNFRIPFHRNQIDELGLYMPEPTTTNYNLDDDNNDDEDNDQDDSVQIEILNLAETNHFDGNRSKTANSSSSNNNRRKNILPLKKSNEWNPSSSSTYSSSSSSGISSTSSGYEWNRKTIGKTPPRMRRSLTVMDNYIYNNDEDDDDDDGDLDDDPNDPNDIGNTNSTNSIDINSFFDQKRVNTRKKLFQSNQKNFERKKNLNQRPDTAFPRSRGLVPK